MKLISRSSEVLCQDPDAVPREVMHRVVSTQQERFYGCLPGT